MTEIEQITLGISAADIVDKINEIIACLNTIQPVTSYEDLEDKPSVNGVTLTGNKTTPQLNIRIDEASDYSSQLEILATKNYVDDVETATIAAAEAAVSEALADKMDSDLSKLKEASYLGDDGYIPVVVNGNLVRMSVKNLADFTNVKRDSARNTMENGTAAQRKYIALDGTQDGSNIDFLTETGFVLGTTALYLNGQLLTRNYDYTEHSAYQIKMLTHIPVSSDILTLMAIPLS